MAKRVEKEQSEHEFKYLKPSDKNAIVYLLDHIEEIRKRIEHGFATVDHDKQDVFRGVTAMIYWKGIVTFNCFKMLYMGGYLQDSQALLRTLLEADIRLAFISQAPKPRAELYIKAATEERKRLGRLLKETRTQVDLQTGTTNQLAGRVVEALEKSLDAGQTDTNKALRFWKRLTFKELCQRTERLHTYIMYSICSQVIHCSSESLGPAQMTKNDYFAWALLDAACSCWLSIARVICSVFAISDVIEYINEVKWWLIHADAEWANSEATKAIQELEP